MKYLPVSEFLLEQDANRIRMAFDQVEEILGFALPKSAAEYQAWWANDPNHSQAKAWLEAGWRTENLNLSGKTVEFVRVRKPSSVPPGSPADPWGALAGTVTIHDEAALTQPIGEVWDAEAGAR
jgi:hypothetical protein